LTIPPGSLVYLDPPYSETKGYGDLTIDHGAFHAWAANLAQHSTVFLSEFSAPPNCEQVWQKAGVSQFGKQGSKPKIERLYRVHPIKH